MTGVGPFIGLPGCAADASERPKPREISKRAVVSKRSVARPKLQWTIWRKPAVSPRFLDETPAQNIVKKRESTAQ